MEMAVIVTVVMGVVVIMGMVVRHRASIRLTGSGAFQFAEGAAFLNPLNVMVVTFLSASHVLLEAQHLGAVFAE